jgi:serine/threonine-protein kinase
MAPEQLEGGRITKAVDIYALGAVAFEMLSGQKARQGRTPVEIAHQIASDPAPDLREAWLDAPPAAAAALEAAMARDPGARPATAGALARELEDALKGSGTRTTRALEGVGAAGVPFQRDERTVAPPLRRREPVVARRTTQRGLPRWIPVAGLILVLLVVAGAIAALGGGGSDKATPPVVPPAKHKPAKPKNKAQTQTTQSAPAQTQTTQSAPLTDAQKGAQLQAQAHDLINQGNFDQAIALDQQAIQLLKGTPGLTYAYALYDLGHALRLAGRPQEAIPILEQRLQINNQRDVVKAELERAKKDAKGKGGGEGDQGNQD